MKQDELIYKSTNKVLNPQRILFRTYSHFLLMPTNVMRSNTLKIDKNIFVHSLTNTVA